MRLQFAIKELQKARLYTLIKTTDCKKLNGEAKVRIQLYSMKLHMPWDACFSSLHTKKHALENSYFYLKCY